ncbi:MAG TPA: GNAT family N-acetyltransferase [Planctomycetota bacterium]|nr:GNAT family N-acetyltransferase [Planctomycetota bacterium]
MLDASVPLERATWVQLWESWPDREVMAHPEFVRLFAKDGQQVLAAAGRGREGGALYPFIRRPLEAEPWCPSGVSGCDLSTAYGYSGPFGWDLNAEETRSFWSQFDRWAREKDVVTSFARLSVFPEDLLPFDGDVTVNSPNIVRNLELSDEELWSDYLPKVRQNVRRALSRGCELQVDADGSRMEEFHHIYTATMTRRNASSYYFFKREFFETILQKLQGHCAFFHVVHEGKVVSSELVLLSRRHAYFFLGGTLAESFELRPNDFLQHETFRWCRDAGKHALVLGGGYRGSEGLLKYKRSFAPRGEVPFKVGMKTYAAALSERLVQERRAWEASRGVEWNPQADYFPGYRSD